MAPLLAHYFPSEALFAVVSAKFELTKGPEREGEIEGSKLKSGPLSAAVVQSQAHSSSSLWQNSNIIHPHHCSVSFHPVP